MIISLNRNSEWKFDNEYFYGEKVGVYLIECNELVILFDLPKFSEENIDFINKFKKPCIALLSHGSTGISDGKKWQENLDIKIYLHKDDKDHSWLKIKPDILYTNPEEINLPDNLEIILTPGHSKGSICLFNKETKTLFAGDTLGAENNQIRDFIKLDTRDEDLGERINSCKNLLNYNFNLLVPFHYKSLENGCENLKNYLNSKLD